MGISGAQKRKKKKEKEELALDMERLKLGPTKLWTGLVLHHKDVFVSHVIPKLNGMDRYFLSKVNTESQDALKYAGVKVSKFGDNVQECSSISTLELLWNHFPFGCEDEEGNVIDQALFCLGVSFTNKLEFLKWAREVKRCEWDEETIKVAAARGNLEMLKYCFSNGCPCDKKEVCEQAAYGGHLDCLRFLLDKVNPSRKTEEDAAHQAARRDNLEMLKYCFSNDCPCDKHASCQHAAFKGHLDCLRFLFDKLKPSRKTEEEAVYQATCGGHTDILKYCVEERKISDEGKLNCVGNATWYGQLDCLKYLVEEAKMPLNNRKHIACARYYKHTDCENYLLEKGSPEPTDEEYAAVVQFMKRTKKSST